MTTTNGPSGPRRPGPAADPKTKRPRPRKGVESSGLWAYLPDLGMIGRVRLAARRATVADDTSDAWVMIDAGPHPREGDEVAHARLDRTVEAMKAAIDDALIERGHALVGIEPAFATYGGLALLPAGGGVATSYVNAGVDSLMGCNTGMPVRVSARAIAYLDEMPEASREALMAKIENVAGRPSGGSLIAVAGA